MHFDILTIFPSILDSYISETLLKRAQKAGIISIRFWDIREFTTDKHKTVDDTPYGGGPGMVLKVEPVFRCLRKVVGSGVLEDKIKKQPLKFSGRKSKIILLSPKGEQFQEAKAEDLSRYEQLIFICGRYEGIDARVENLVDEQISIGPYILSGGELGAMVIIEAVTRLIPGVLGSSESLVTESHQGNGSSAKQFIEYPQYTRPEIFQPISGVEWRVPETLVSGDHKKIEEWKRLMMKPRE